MDFVFNKKYMPLFRSLPDVRYYVMTGGRASGKSFALSAGVGTELFSLPTKKNILYLRQTLVSANISIIPEFFKRIEEMGYNQYAKMGKTEIVNLYSGSRIFFRGIQTSRGSNEANLKSVSNVSTVYVDEAQELVDEDVFDRIDLSLRDLEVNNRVVLSLNPTSVDHWIYRRFFRDANIDDEFNGIVGNVCYIHTDYRENSHLPKGYKEMAEEMKAKDLEKYENIWLGRWRRNKEGALWRADTMINPYRLPAESLPSLLKSLDRIVIAIDPAVTGQKGKSDETGIVVAGIRNNGAGKGCEFFVLGDYSVTGSPNEWVRIVSAKFRELEADRVIGEVNNGGDLIETVIRNYDRGISYSSVRATRGKIVRAEPISELYERGLVHHVGFFPEMEKQMCEYTGEASEKSPDRMDALVWALTELSSRTSGRPFILA